MSACATRGKIVESIPVGNLILPVPDTDFREFLDEVEELAGFAPEIIGAIEKDMDRYAREKKSLRLADQKFLESRPDDLPAMHITERNILAEELKRAVGRPRMPGYAVYVFLMIRGFLGSLTTKPARRFLRESMSLYGFLHPRGRSRPGMTTILENVNLVSSATRERIFDPQIAWILGEQRDDFKTLTIESTAVKANSSWPTDAKILTGWLMRANRLGQKLHLFGLKDFRPGRGPGWLTEMDPLEFQIGLAAGKPKSKGKLKKHYRQLLKRGRKATDFLATEWNRLEETLSLETLAPSRRVLVQRVLQQIRGDLRDANRVLEYAQARVFHDQVLPSTEKVLSWSDGSPAFIKKGSRHPLIGYQPQRVRSGQGFVTSLIVPRGNAADSVERAPAIADSMVRTGGIADWVSTDDGYASAKGRDDVLALKGKDIRISGAKGKKLSAPEDWDSQEYRDARRNRSAVESLMFTIKDGFEFGEWGRRGLQAVRDELLDKVLAYNCCRIIFMKNRRREELEKAA